MIVLRNSIAGVSPAGLARFAARAQRAAGLSGRVDVLLTSNGELRTLNRAFRHKDETTDVLSFPAARNGTRSPLAGEIAISTDIARANARRFGHALATELKILMLHGMLHLAGHDHETDTGEMARLEERLRRELRLPVMTLIERARGDAGDLARVNSARADRPRPHKTAKAQRRRP